MNKPRTLYKTIEKLSKSFPILLLTGPRQVGKTTLLSEISSHHTYITLDDLEERNLAMTDPALFLQLHKGPLIIDEVQYAPQLFSYLKMKVDLEKSPGMFWLTGSQKFHLMEGITETLAGRVVIIDMLGLSQSEFEGRALESIPFLPSIGWLDHKKTTGVSRKSIMDIYKNIWMGSYPGLVLDPLHPRDSFYNSYIQTYLQRDVRALTKVGDEMIFLRFLKTLAARTAQLINYAEIARDVDVDQKTIKAWISILETSGLIYILQPYHSNYTKRLIKSPKIYFLDTGLCSYLTNWSSPEVLESGAMSGAILETYVMGELLKSYWHNGQKENIYFYRDQEGHEVDFLIEQDNTLYPIECKKSATPSLSSIKNFKILEKMGKKIGCGSVLCLRETETYLNKDVMVIPIGYL
jgi:uncharacterized protein